MATAVLRPLPRWVRIIDALTVTAVLVAFDVWLSGGFAASVGPVRLSIRSPGRIFLTAVVLGVIRHLLFRGEPLHRRMLNGLSRVRRSDAAPVVAVALISRAAVLVVALFAVLTFGLSQPEVGFTLADDPLLNLPARFDAGWYGTIAQDGYSFDGRYDRQQNIAFFPAFPLLMRGASAMTGGFAPGIPKPWRQARMMWGGVLLSIAAFMWAAVYVFRLARDMGFSARAHASVSLLAAYPFAAYYSAAYTEGVFLLGSVAAFYHFRRREWMASMSWGVLVGLTRPNGCLLSIALAVLIVEEWRRSHGEGASYPVVVAFAAASAPGIGLILYSAYIKSLTGSWLAWARVQEAWGRSFEGLAPLERGAGWVWNEGLLSVVSHLPFDALNAAALVFAILLIWPIWRRLGAAWAVFVLINIGIPFVGGGVLSLGRMTSTLFPLFIALAAILPETFVTPVVLSFAIAQGLVAALFFTWRPMF
ncbi:MAG TPA: mannosyltransferase family protein [Vicinamibacterales bacterium]|jgi:hypothetical protein|nr:mannosyltransferase family protein [Vicinamibacterales bacterium]